MGFPGNAFAANIRHPYHRHYHHHHLQNPLTTFFVVVPPNCEGDYECFHRAILFARFHFVLCRSAIEAGFQRGHSFGVLGDETKGAAVIRRLRSLYGHHRHYHHHHHSQNPLTTFFVVVPPNCEGDYECFHRAILFARFHVGRRSWRGFNEVTPSGFWGDERKGAAVIRRLGSLYGLLGSPLLLILASAGKGFSFSFSRFACFNEVTPLGFWGDETKGAAVIRHLGSLYGLLGSPLLLILASAGKGFSFFSLVI